MKTDGSQRRRIYDSTCCVGSLGSADLVTGWKEDRVCGGLGPRNLHGRRGRNKPTPAKRRLRKWAHVAATALISALKSLLSAGNRKSLWPVPICTVTVAVVVGTAGAVPTSPAGTLVFATAGDGANRLEIALAKPDGTGFAKLTHQAPGGSAPHWAANGRSIVFEAGSQLWRMTPRGTRLHQIRASGEPSPSATRFARLLKHGVDIVSAKGRLVRRIRLPLGRNDYYDSVLVVLRQWKHRDRSWH